VSKVDERGARRLAASSRVVRFRSSGARLLPAGGRVPPCGPLRAAPGRALLRASPEAHSRRERMSARNSPRRAAGHRGACNSVIASAPFAAGHYQTSLAARQQFAGRAAATRHSCAQSLRGAPSRQRRRTGDGRKRAHHPLPLIAGRDASREASPVFPSLLAYVTPLVRLGRRAGASRLTSASVATIIAAPSAASLSCSVPASSSGCDRNHRSVQAPRTGVEARVHLHDRNAGLRVSGKNSRVADWRRAAAQRGSNEA